MADTKRLEDARREEVDAAAYYRALAELATEPKLQKVYERLASDYAQLAERLGERLRACGVEPSPLSPSPQAQRRIRWARRLGTPALLPTAPASGEPERSHSRLMAVLQTLRGGLGGGALARLEGRHGALSGNSLRAAVLGANDGLVSNLNLLMGVAGAAFASRTILMTGLAGLLAGAFSMALGEWLSVQSARELAQRQIAIEAYELEDHPEEEEAELSLIYQSKGIPPEQAAALARRMIADPSVALDTLVREELGLDPDELGGSAWEAALVSFLLFGLGAAVPVVPFLFLAGSGAVAASVGLSGLALFGLGVGSARLTGRSWLLAGLRQLAFGLAAAAAVYGIGRLIGVSLS